MGRKALWEKEKLLLTSNFSFSLSVFKGLLLQTHKNQGLFGKGFTDKREICFTAVASSFCFINKKHVQRFDNKKQPIFSHACAFRHRISKVQSTLIVSKSELSNFRISPVNSKVQTLSLLYFI